jgi:hypothetical protein
LPYTGLGKVIVNELFIWGFLGLVVINILLFVTSLFSGLGSLRKSRAKEDSQQQEGQDNEKALEELLQGKNITQQKMPRWARIGIAVCIGLIFGSILGFILNRIII